MNELNSDDIKFYESILDEGLNAATYVPFGFEFQADAGLFLLLKFYDVVESIQIESRLQDIEIAKNDGKIILAQAKASEKPLGSNPNEKSKLSDAILSLIKSDREKVDKLIYVSNLVDPLLSNEKHEFDSKIVNYEYLSEDAKNSITNALSEIEKKLQSKITDKSSTKRSIELSKLIVKNIDNLNKSKIEIITIPRYYGDEERAIEVKNKLKEFLHDRFGFSDGQCISLGNEIYKRVHSFFVFENSVGIKSKIKIISKKDFAWFSIIVATEAISPSEALEKFGEEFDDDIADKIQGYSYEFNKYLEYEKLTKILADYYDYRKKASKDYLAFINDKYMSYIDDFQYIENGDEKRMMIKCMLYKVFKKYNMVSHIIEGVN